MPHKIPPLPPQKRRRRGATSIEYGLICALIFLALLAAAHELSDSIEGTWRTIASGLQGRASDAAR